jgi:uncharacterized protein (TIGR02594 family)
MNVLDIQRRLLALGFNPGAVDGAWGPRTRAAVIAFQKSAGLDPDGVVGPKTIDALNTHALHPPAPVLTPGEPVWVLEGRRKLGLRETNPEVAKFLKSDGRTVGDPSKIPWCGDFVETCIRVALPEEIVPTNPYLARNWMGFGVKCPDPVVGAIAVFWRGSKTGTQGHVGFVVGQDAKYLSILGGNQGVPSASAASTKPACSAAAGRSPPAQSRSRRWAPRPATSRTTRREANSDGLPPALSPASWLCAIASCRVFHALTGLRFGQFAQPHPTSWWPSPACSASSDPPSLCVAQDCPRTVTLTRR